MFHTFFAAKNHLAFRTHPAKKIFTILLFTCPLFCFSQQQPMIWYFGYGAGVDFTSGSPVSINGGALNQWEGVTTACDQSGNLLFYSDGLAVWNSNHQVMPNGYGLMGDNSSTQSATTVPMPGNASQYYLFTCPEHYAFNGFRYSIIDMTLSSGLGDVTSVKNVWLADSTTEQCAVIPTSNGCTWVVTRGYEPVWYAFLIDSFGIHPPVLSYAGSVFNPVDANGVGYMKASSLHDKIAIANYGYSAAASWFEVYDFDHATGIVSNAFQLQPNSPTGVYGCEFSPDGTRFYGAEWGPLVYQYDMTAGSPADIAASQTLVGIATGSVGDMQIGPDGKIHCAINGGTTLAVINDPNNLGTACNFSNSGIYLNGNSSGIGLPSTELFANCVVSPPVASFQSVDTSYCANSCIDFTNISQYATSYQWQFPGGSPSSSTLQNPTNICYNTAGTYDVTLIATNSVGSDTLALSNFVTILTAPVAAITQFGNTLSTTVAFSYQWSYNGSLIPGATNQELEISQTGTYSVTVTDNSGCSDADTLVVTFIPANNLSATDTLLCQKFCIDFTDQSTNSPTAWLWQFPGGIPSFSTNQNPVNICYDNTGTFDVTLITTNAFGTDTLTLIDYITVYPTPPFPVITQSGYTLTSSFADFYQWQFNSVDIPGATNQSYTATQTGYYTVVVSDVNGCVSSTTMFVEITGIEDLIAEQNILIYPNPSNGSFIIEWSNPANGGTGGSIAGSVSIEIYNTLGQLVFSSEESRSIGTSPWKKDIDLTHVASGIYFVEIFVWVDAEKSEGKYLSRKKLLVR